jgi:hypothetical protein
MEHEALAIYPRVSSDSGGWLTESRPATSMSFHNSAPSPQSRVTSSRASGSGSGELALTRSHRRSAEGDHAAIEAGGRQL